MNEIRKFDPEIKKIENDVLEFLLINPLFSLQKSMVSTIKAYFITRESLTQELINKLTGFSRGKISQELKKLLDTGFIEKLNVSSKGEITYTMKSVSRTFVKNFFNSQKEIFDFFNEINELKKEMDSEKEEIGRLHGYNDVYDVLLLFTSSLPLVEKVVRELEKELANLEKV